MKTRTRRFVKLTTGTELRTQVVTAIKVRRGPANDNVDFGPVVRRAHRIKRIKLGIGDKGYDAEKNHELLRDELHAQSIIPARHEDVPIWRTRGRYRKEMKRGYSKARYHQRSKDETVFSVIKEDHGGRGQVDGREGAKQRDEAEDNLLQRGEDSESGSFFTQGISTEPA